MGDTATLADIVLVPQVTNARRYPQIDLKQFPNILRIDTALRQINAFDDAAPENQPRPEAMTRQAELTRQGSGSRSGARRGQASKQAHADMPEGTYEREMSKEGFFGPGRLLPSPQAARQAERFRRPATAARIRPDEAYGRRTRSPWDAPVDPVEQGHRECGWLVSANGRIRPQWRWRHAALHS